MLSSGGISLIMNIARLTTTTPNLHDGDAGGVHILHVKSGSASTIVLNSSHVDGNTCTDDGGGIDAEDVDALSDRATNSTVNNNVATGPHVNSTAAPTTPSAAASIWSLKMGSRSIDPDQQ